MTNLSHMQKLLHSDANLCVCVDINIVNILGLICSVSCMEKFTHKYYLHILNSLYRNEKALVSSLTERIIVTSFMSKFHRTVGFSADSSVTCSITFPSVVKLTAVTEFLKNTRRYSRTLLWVVWAALLIPVWIPGEKLQFPRHVSYLILCLGAVGGMLSWHI